MTHNMQLRHRRQSYRYLKTSKTSSKLFTDAPPRKARGITSYPVASIQECRLATITAAVQTDADGIRLDRYQIVVVASGIRRLHELIEPEFTQLTWT